MPALAALALEMELIAKPARSSTGVPAAAIYRREMAAIAVAATAPRKSDGRTVALAEHGLPPWPVRTPGGRGELNGYFTCVHLMVSICTVLLSTLHATE